MIRHELDFLLITKQFPPRIGGRSSLFRDVARKFPDKRLIVSSTARRGAKRIDRGFPGEVLRSPTFLVGEHGLGLSLWRTQLGWLCRRRKPALTVAAGCDPEGFLALGLRERFGIPYLLHLEAPQLLEIRNETRKGGESGRRFGELVANTEAILVPSRTCWLEAYKLDIHPHQIRVLPPGIDLERFRPGETSSGLVEKLRSGSGPVLLSVLGESPGKDLETLLRAFAAVRSQRKLAVLVIVGGGDSRPWRRLAEKLRVESHVRFVGAVGEDELPEYYRLADVFLMAHREDRDSWILQGMEISFLEAMASGLPIAATRTRATAEIVSEDVGVLVEPDAHARLGRAVLEILQGRSKELAERARSRAEEEFGAARAAEEFREFLEVLYYRRLGLGTLEHEPEPPVEIERAPPAA